MVSRVVVVIATTLLAALAHTAKPAPAATAPATQSSGPRLIVAISVDQFSADLFAEYRMLFTAGLRRLQTGVVFPDGYQSHAATETCPGHSTLLTGSHPARTGIIANEWYDQSIARPEKKVYCAEDPALRDSNAPYTVSAQALKVQTLGDRLKAADPRSRVVSVAGKDRAAIMMGGHSIDQAWFWNGRSYVTLRETGGTPPAVIAQVNAAVTALLAKSDPRPLPAACGTRSAAINVAGHSIGVLQTRKAADQDGFRTTLAFDRATSDIAIGFIRDLKLGSGPAIDVLSIGLSATDYVGHTFGTEGPEMCAQLLGVDDNVGRILQALDATHQPYVVVLSADHGGHDVPERNQLRGMGDAARVDPALLPNAVGRLLAAEFHLPEPALLGTGPFGDLYLSRDVPAPLRARVLDSAKSRYQAHPQVAAVFTASELRRMPMPTGPADEWSLADRFRASFDPERSGDLLVALKPHITPIADARTYVATHGSPWNYDRRVPILFYRPNSPGFEQPLAVETVDILPTLAALIGLSIPPSQIDGRCLDLDASPADTCTPH